VILPSGPRFVFQALNPILAFLQTRSFLWCQLPGLHALIDAALLFRLALVYVCARLTASGRRRMYFC
jgi:hypothetical protein